MAANAELFMMLPATVALWLFLGRIPGRTSHVTMALCGLLATAAILVKSTALFTVAVIPFVLVIDAVRGPARVRHGALADLAIAAFAAAALVGVVLYWFAHQGSLARYLFATIDFNRMYVAGVPFGESWQQFTAFFAWAAVGDIFTTVAILGVIFLLGRRNAVAPDVKIFLFGLSVLSLLGVIAARNLFFHYYLQMALPLALIATLFASTLRIDPTDWRRITSIALLLGVASAWSPHRFDWEALTRRPEEDRVLLEVANFIEGNGSEDDTLYVLGGEPILYFLCGRTSPSEYFFWLYATDRWDSILRSKSSLLQTFELHPPDWFVYAPHDLRVPELEDFMYENYTLVHRIGDYEIAVRANL